MPALGIPGCMSCQEQQKKQQRQIPMKRGRFANQGNRYGQMPVLYTDHEVKPPLKPLPPEYIPPDGEPVYELDPDEEYKRMVYTTQHDQAMKMVSATALPELNIGLALDNLPILSKPLVAGITLKHVFLSLGIASVMRSSYGPWALIGLVLLSRSSVLNPGETAM